MTVADRSFRLRLWGSIGALLVLLVAGAAWLVADHRRQDIAVAEHVAAQELELLASLIADDLRRGNYQHVEEVLQAWGGQHDEVATLSLTAANGFLLAGYQRGRNGTLLRTLSRELDYGYSGHARLEMGWDTGPAAAQARALAVQLAFAVAVLVVFLGALGRYAERDRRRRLELQEAMADLDRAASALAESESRFRVLFDNAPLAYQSLDMAANILDVNQAWLDLFGVTDAKAVRGRCISEFLADESHPVLARQFPEFIASGALQGPVFTIRRADGSCRKVTVNGRIGRAPDGTPERTHCLLTDITAKVEADAERARLQDQLQRAQKLEAIGRLAGGVAHDYNNMLGVILGRVDLALEACGPDAPLQRHLTEIRAAACRSAAVTRQLLAFARQQPVSPRSVDLGAAIGERLGMLASLVGDDRELVWEASEGGWPVMIDPVQVDQILTNLCANARDALPPGGRVTIRLGNFRLRDEDVRGVPEATPGDYVRLSVSDNGSGMTPEVLRNVFEPFYTSKGVGQGTGLGLATVYGIVRQCGGFITVVSEPGRGADFRVHLPRAAAPVAAPEPPAPAIEGGRETLLVVEDEPDMLAVTREILEPLGYQVYTAGTPEQALDIVARDCARIDLMLVDVVMPGMNGPELVEQVRRRCPEVRHLYLSGYPADVVAQRGVRYEGSDFLQKPFTREALSRRVRDALRP